MGNECGKCCSQTDGDSELNDGRQTGAAADPSTTAGGPDRKSGVAIGARRSNEFTKGALQNRGLKPEVSRSGQHFDFKYTNGAKEQLDIAQVTRLQAIVRGFIQRRKYKLHTTKMHHANGMYFKREELYETLQDKDQKFDKSAPVKDVKYTYKSTGSVYEGQLKGGFRDGKGTMTWTDTARYEGEWEMGYACGKGTFYHADGDIYEGVWNNNKCNGYGVYTNKKGARYEGYWKNDTQSGQGTEVWPEGSKYVGQYVNGKKQGTGKYSWADGSVYQGDWVDNRINGVGQYKWKDGRKYYGHWYNNDMHGMGIYIYTDGVTYEGQYKEDKKTGYGLYFWTDGRKYDGWWYNGKQHGLGIYKDPSKGKVKYGLWEHGKRITWFSPQAIYQINEH